MQQLYDVIVTCDSTDFEIVTAQFSAQCAISERDSGHTRRVEQYIFRQILRKAYRIEKKEICLGEMGGGGVFKRAAAILNSSFDVTTRANSRFEICFRVN